MNMNRKTSELTDDPYAENRDNKGRFTAGNPGKPRGARSQLSRRAFNTVSESFDGIIAILINKALNGETDAAKLLISMVLPKSPPPEIDDLDTPDDLIAHVSAGNLTPEDGQRLAAMFKTISEAGELSEIRKKLELLEAILKQ